MLHARIGKSVILIVGLAGVSYGAEPGACDAVADVVPATLSIEACQAVDPLTVELRRVKQEMLSCELPDGTTVEHALTQDDLINHRIRLSRGEQTLVEFQTEPRSAVRADGFGAATAIACDDGGRFYYVHTYLGYLVAFDRDGRELWRRDLPDFVRSDSRLAGQTIDMMQAFEAYSDWASKGQQVRANGEYVVVEYKTVMAETWHAVYHRSGAYLGRVGPWDGVMVGATEDGFELVAGGGGDMRFYVPKVELRLAIRDRTTASLVYHGLAWFMPRPTDRRLEMNCLARLPNELEYWLGERYVAEHARESKQMAASLGKEWYARIAASSGVQPLIEDFNPPSREWQRAFWDSMIESGADVDLAGTLQPFEISDRSVRGTLSPASGRIDSGGDTDKAQSPELALADLTGAEIPIMANFDGVPLGSVFDLLAAATGLDVDVAESLHKESVSLSYGRTALQDALGRMAEDFDLHYHVSTPDALMVDRH